MLCCATQKCQKYTNAMNFQISGASFTDYNKRTNDVQNLHEESIYL